MRSWVKAVLIVVTVAFAPAAASANGLRTADVVNGRDAITIRVDASDPIGEPRVRSSRGMIRVWLPEMDDDVRLDPETDGSALRWVRIRPGMAGTSVVQIRVGDDRVVSPSAVRIERGGNSAFIHVERAALPATRLEYRAPPPASADVPEIADPIPAERDMAEGDAEGDEEAAETAAATEGPAPAETAAHAIAPASGMSARPLSSDTGPTLPLLVFVTVLLGGAYLAMRWVMKKKRKDPLADIEVVASRRIGTRHQIVLVRALGEDHLLSINGNNTQCISSTPTVRDEEAREEDPAAGILARLQDRVAKIRTDERIEESGPVPVVPTARKADPENRFGAELMRYAFESERPAAVPAVRRVRKRRPSESVAGLVQLRERLAANG